MHQLTKTTHKSKYQSHTRSARVAASGKSGALFSNKNNTSSAFIHTVPLELTAKWLLTHQFCVDSNDFMQFLPVM